MEDASARSLPLAVPFHSPRSVEADPLSRRTIARPGSRVYELPGITAAGRVSCSAGSADTSGGRDYQTVNKRRTRIGTKTSARTTTPIAKLRDARRCSESPWPERRGAATSGPTAWAPAANGQRWASDTRVTGTRSKPLDIENRSQKRKATGGQHAARRGEERRGDFRRNGPHNDEP